jgi:hypothetical protein
MKHETSESKALRAQGAINAINTVYGVAIGAGLALLLVMATIEALKY